MAGLKKSSGNIKLMGILNVMLIILCALPRDYSIWTYISGISSRQFGSSIGISIPFMLLILMGVINLRHLNFLVNYNARLVHFFLFVIFSIVFPIDERIWSLSFIGLFKFLLFFGLYIHITNFIAYPSFKRCLDIGFSVALILQSILGMLYEFSKISIPYISYGSESVRNGISRMTGTFAHPGDFSFYISIIYLYFACKFFFEKDKKVAIFIVICLIDLYFSGARTMLVASSIIILIILWRKYKRNIGKKFLIIAFLCAFMLWFYRSGIFQELFIKNNIFDMFTARLIHWEIGIEIISASINNFIFGVGLNNHVDYIDANYSLVSFLITNPKVLDEEFVRGMPIHNSFLVIGSEIGAIGLTMYVLIFISAIRKSISIIRLHPDYKACCYFIISSMVAFIIYGFQGWALLKDFGWILFIIVNAYLYSIEKQISIKKQLSEVK